MTKLVTIFGGSGFVGRYIAQKLAAEGWRVRVAVRRPNEALHVRPYGDVGQVEPVFCNIRSDESVALVMSGADAVINCVGTFERRGKNNFDAIQAEGATRIARVATEHGVKTLTHISALGTEHDTLSDYARTKREGEAGVLQHFPSATILRPSVIFGPEDGFFNKLANLSRFGPFYITLGGKTKLQPVYVEDVAAAAVAGANGEASGIYELGGHDVKTVRGWVDVTLSEVMRKKVVINAPNWIGRIMAWGFDTLQFLSLGLFKNTFVTRDQLKMLQTDNVVSEDARTLADLGIKPTSAEAVIEGYLWRYRPSGQYDAIRESASNLKA